VIQVNLPAGGALILARRLRAFSNPYQEIRMKKLFAAVFAALFALTSTVALAQAKKEEMKKETTKKKEKKGGC
jgi:hypothetical protein